MKTLLEILQRTTDFLAGKGIAEPRLEAEILLAESLGMPRLNLYLNFERPLTETELDSLRSRVRQRGKRIPIQQIIGHTEFHQIDLRIPPGILIPRPETEELVEWVLSHYPIETHPHLRVLDLGCGSGAIGLALKNARPGWDLHLRDKSPAAIAAAEANLQHLGLEATVSLGSWTDGITPGFDLVVSNPPYLTEAEWNSSQPEVRLHEPREALVGGGTDGASALRAILAAAPSVLRPGGSLFCETGTEQHPLIRDLAPHYGYAVCDTRKDLSGRPRMIRLSLGQPASAQTQAANASES